MVKVTFSMGDISWTTILMPIFFLIFVIVFVLYIEIGRDKKIEKDNIIV